MAYTLTVRLPDDLEPRIRGQAWAEHVSVNKWIAYAILDRLDRKEAERDSGGLSADR